MQSRLICIAITMLSVTRALGTDSSGIPSETFTTGTGGYGFTSRTLALHSDGSFIRVDQTCFVTRDTGKATIDDGRLLLHFEQVKRADIVIPVTWGRRHYLLFEHEMIAFCNEVNSGDEPRTSESGSFLLRRGDWVVKVSGVPTVPERYRFMLLPAPIRGIVVHVHPDGSATLNLGLRDSVFVGMTLTQLTDQGEQISLTVTSVTDTDCIAICTDGKTKPTARAAVVSRLSPAESDAGDAGFEIIVAKTVATMI